VSLNAKNRPFLACMKWYVENETEFCVPFYRWITGSRRLRCLARRSKNLSTILLIQMSTESK